MSAVRVKRESIKADNMLGDISDEMILLGDSPILVIDSLYEDVPFFIIAGIYAIISASSELYFIVLLLGQ